MDRMEKSEETIECILLYTLRLPTTSALPYILRTCGKGTGTHRLRTPIKGAGDVGAPYQLFRSLTSEQTRMKAYRRFYYYVSIPTEVSSPLKPCLASLIIRKGRRSSLS